MCKSNGKSMDQVACTLCNAFFNCFELSWVVPSNVTELFVCWLIGSSTQECCCIEYNALPLVVSIVEKN
jgi:hypothetical protein